MKKRTIVLEVMLKLQVSIHCQNVKSAASLPHALCQPFDYIDFMWDKIYLAVALQATWKGDKDYNLSPVQFCQLGIKNKYTNRHI